MAEPNDAPLPEPNDAPLPEPNDAPLPELLSRLTDDRLDKRERLRLLTRLVPLVARRLGAAVAGARPRHPAGAPRRPHRRGAGRVVDHRRQQGDRGGGCGRWRAGDRAVRLTSHPAGWPPGRSAAASTCLWPDVG